MLPQPPLPPVPPVEAPVPKEAPAVASQVCCLMHMPCAPVPGLALCMHEGTWLRLHQLTCVALVSLDYQPAGTFT